MANNAFACAWMLFVIFWSFWPPDAKPAPRTMNWSVVVTGAVVGFSVLYYVVWGRRGFREPVVEVEVGVGVEGAEGVEGVVSGREGRV